MSSSCTHVMFELLNYTAFTTYVFLHSFFTASNATTIVKPAQHNDDD